ncbi:MAG TPA: WbqC family protein [Candidatus Binatia bacterium]|nr:WbqC family protein [Candidatus Binatia bacterium]
MRVVILQPGYLPWLGFFDQFYQCDLFVFFDDVQFDRRGWRHRNRIKCRTGAQWLTVPVQSKGRFTQTIRETRIDTARPWQRKHLGSVRACYARAAYFDCYYPEFERIVQRPWQFLIDLDLAVIDVLLAWLGLDRPRRLASEIGGAGSATQRLVEICRAVGATEYLSGESGAAYLDESLLRTYGMALCYQHYAHPTYRQLFGPFVSHLSVIDLLFNHGPESLAILTGQPVDGANQGARADHGARERGSVPPVVGRRP